MSQLRDALNRIINYLEKNDPDAANWLQPGLSDSEIAEITQDLPFELPLEIKELYRWRNGKEINEHNWEQGYKSAFIFPGNGYYFLCSLEEVVHNYCEYGSNELNSNELNIFQSLPEGTAYFYLDTKRVIFYVSNDWEDGSSSYQYSSLTNMMLTIAEGYETGIFNSDRENYIQPNLENYVLNSTRLWWKYNADIQDLLLKQLQSSQYNFNYWLKSQYDLILFKDSRVIPILIEIIQTPACKIEQFNKQNIYDYERILKSYAIDTLGYLGDIRAVKPIIDILKDRNQDQDTHLAAIEALRKLKNDLAVQPLIEILQNNKSESLISLASWALRDLGKAAVEPLIKILQHENFNVRMFAASALGNIGDQRAIKPLYNLLQNQTSISHELLYSLGGGGFPPIASALAQLQATDELIASLNHQNPIVRQQAVWALGNIIDLNVIPPLIKALKDHEQEVRKEARQSLIKLSSESTEIESILPF